MSGYSEPPPPGGYAPPPGYQPPPSQSYSNAPMMMSPMVLPPPPPPPPVGDFGGAGRRAGSALNRKKRKEICARRAVVVELTWNVLEFIGAIVLLYVLQFGLEESPLPNTLAFTIPWIAIILLTIVLDILFLSLKWLKNSRMMIVWLAGVTVKLCVDISICLAYIIAVSPKVQAEGYRIILIIWGIFTALDVFLSIPCLSVMGIYWGFLRTGGGAEDNNGPYYTRRASYRRLSIATPAFPSSDV